MPIRILALALTLMLALGACTNGMLATGHPMGGSESGGSAGGMGGGGGGGGGGGY